jgi:hypothetical protein
VLEEAREALQANDADTEQAVADAVAGEREAAAGARDRCVARPL